MKVYCVFRGLDTPELEKIFTLPENAEKWKSEQKLKHFYFVREWELEGSPWDMDIW